MPRAILIILIGLSVSSAHAQNAAQENAKLVGHLRQVYDGWRNSVIKKDSGLWKRYTSNVRQVNVRNRLWSQRRRFPDGVFNLPAAPPSLAPLKPLRVRVKGPTAKSVYYGKVDFGVGGKPTKNLYVISYVQERTGWKYNGAEFINLNALPDVRKELDTKDYKYVDQDDFKPNGILEKAPRAITGLAPYIAQAYVYCPGREVELLINKISRHKFQNNKKAEVIIGGAHLGVNEMQFTIKDIPGGDPKAPIAIRFYLMSEIPGTKIPAVLEYQVDDGSKPKSSGVLRFNLTKEIAKKLR